MVQAVQRARAFSMDASSKGSPRPGGGGGSAAGGKSEATIHSSQRIVKAAAGAKAPAAGEVIRPLTSEAVMEAERLAVKCFGEIEEVRRLVDAPSYGAAAAAAIFSDGTVSGAIAEKGARTLSPEG